MFGLKPLFSFYLCVFVKKIMKCPFHLFLRSGPTAAQGLSANNWSRAAVWAGASPHSPPPRTWLVINFVRRVPPVYSGATDRSERIGGGGARPKRGGRHRHKGLLTVPPSPTPGIVCTTCTATAASASGPTFFFFTERSLFGDGDNTRKTETDFIFYTRSNKSITYVLTIETYTVVKRAG